MMVVGIRLFGISIRGKFGYLIIWIVRVENVSSYLELKVTNFEFG